MEGSRESKITSKCRQCFLAVESAVENTVQWKNPISSSLYLLLMNASFWYVVFYTNRREQRTALVGVVFGLVSLDFSSRLLSSQPRARLKTLSDEWDSFQQKNAREKALWLLIFLLTLGPFRLILTPPLFYFWSWIYEKTSQVLIIILCSLSFVFLQKNDKEKACWLAYCTVVFVLMVPAWRAHRVNERVLSGVGDCLDCLRRRVWTPLTVAVLAVLRTLRYYLCGHWMAPLRCRVRTALADAGAFIRTRCLEPTARFFHDIFASLRYYLCGHWVPSLLENLNNRRRSFISLLNVSVCQPVKRQLLRIWSGLTYVFLGGWVPALTAWFHRVCLTPVLAACRRVKSAVLYVVLGGWIPAFLDLLRNWRDAVQIFLKTRILSPIVQGLVQLKIRVKTLIRVKLVEPTAAFLRKLVKQTKLAIKNRLLLPTLNLILQALSTFASVAYEQLFIPAWIYATVWIRRTKHYAWIQWIDPGMDWLRANFPKRPPFVDDSDTELRDFLPRGSSKPRSLFESETEEDSMPASLIPTTRGSSRALSRRDSEESDEAEYMKGLKFPTIHDSDSSDEEFTLRIRRRKKQRPAILEHEMVQAQLLNEYRDAIPAAPGEAVEEDLLPPPIPDLDDEFEVLDADDI